MAITYPINIPATPGFRTIRWLPRSAVEDQESLFSYYTTTYVWSGQLREVEVSLPPMDLANAKLWTVFALKLNGLEGSFYLRDSLYTAIRGAVADSYSGAKVKGGSQISKTVVTDGWPTSVTGLLKAGDWLSISDRLYEVLNDVDSDGSGEASIDVWPKVAGPADNADISVGGAARGLFKLKSWPDWGWDTDRLCSGFTFSAKEKITQ